MTTAALLALFVVASPASAELEYIGPPKQIDWLLAAVLTALALGIFYYVLEVMNPRP